MAGKLKHFLCLTMLMGICLTLCGCFSTISQDPSEWRPTIGNCWVCALYGSSFQVANEIVFSATEVMMPLARIMLGIGLLFLILFRVGSMTLFMSTKDMGKTLKETAFVFLKAGFVALLIYNGDDFLYMLRDYIIYPVGEFFLMLANAVLDCVPGSGQYFAGIEGLTPKMDGVVVDLTGKIAPIDPDKTIFGDLGIQVQYTVSRIFVSLKTGTLLVLRMVADGGPVAWVLGLVAGWQTFSLMVIFPMAFVDGFIMLAFYTVFLPFTIVLWVFPATKGYLKSIVPNLLAPFVQILFGCILVVLLITLVQVYADMGLNGILRQSTQDANAWVAESAASARPPIIILVLLLISIKKIAAEIGDFTQLFAGTKTDATLFGMIDKARRAAKEALKLAGEVALAVATGGSTAAATVARRAAREAAQKAIREAQKKALEAAREALNGKEGDSGGTS